MILERPAISPAPRCPTTSTSRSSAPVSGASHRGPVAGLGCESIRLIDKAADVGGTWYWNRYPGIACDVESYVYMPLLEELGYVPTEKYAKGDEIFAHCRRIAEHYDLYRDVCLQTEVSEIRWDPAFPLDHLDQPRRRDPGTVRVDGQRVSAEAETTRYRRNHGVRGHAFHTSRWDYDYTGADLAKLSDKRVGIIGTGATRSNAFRTSRIGRAPAGLPAHAVHRRCSRQSPDRSAWSTDLAGGWQRRRIENFQLLTAGGEADEDLVDDAWTSIVKKLFVMRQNSIAGMSDEESLRTVEMADFAKMEEIRARVDSIVADPATAEALKPWYGYFCKRPCFHDEYLQTFNRDNVTLVDTHGKGVERITAGGVVVDGPSTASTA